MISRFPASFLAVAMLAAAASSARAQHVDVDRLRDSLKAQQNVPDLRKREDALKRITGKNPELMLERGIVLLRLYQLTSSDHDIDQARDVFQKAVKTKPNDARGYYGLGLSLSDGHGTRVPSPFGVLNKVATAQSVAEVFGADHASRAARAYQKALDLDPALTGAAIQLAQLAIEKHDRELLQASRDALVRLRDLGSSNGDVLSALSQTEAALGDVEAAAASASAAVESGTGDASTNLLNKAAALLRHNERMKEATAAYFEGIEQLTDESAAHYYRDLQPILGPGDAAAWSSMSLDRKKDFLRGFWDLRAATSGLTIGDRLAEHYKRLADATEKYRRIGKRGAPADGAVLNNEFAVDQLPFDDRGAIYVRHGKPIEIVRTSSPDLRPNESWVYRRPDGKYQMYNFVVLRSGTDYRLVADIFQAMDPSTQAFPFDAVQDMLKDRGAYEPRYYKLATRLEQVRHNAWMAGAMQALGSESGAQNGAAAATGGMQDIGTQRQLIAETNRLAAREAARTDSDQPDFERDLPFYYDLINLKGAKGKTDVTAAVAVPGSSLQPQQVQGDYVYSVELSLILVDTTAHTIARNDTAISVRSRRILGDGEYVRLTSAVTAAPSSSVVHRVVVKDLARPGRGQLYGGDLKVRSFAGQALSISDVVLAEPESGTWKRGDVRLGLVPPRQFTEGLPLRLFYELYNLPKDTHYRTEITIAPTEAPVGFARLKKLFGGSGGTIRLSFEGAATPAADGIVQESRKVTTALKPGRYRVSIKVTNLTNNETTAAETRFLVQPRR